MLTDEDLELFDIISFCYRSFALINDLTNILINDAETKRLTPVTQFYHSWSEKRIGHHELPLNPGTMLMITWAVIVNSKEKWFEFIPDTSINKSPPEWGLQKIKLRFSDKSAPSIRDVVWKIRNSMSHSDFLVNPGKEGTGWSIFLSETTFTFKDSKTGTFELIINMTDLALLNSAIYESILQKMLEYEHLKSTES